MVADRVAKVGFSSTLKISARAKSMRADGIDVIDFSVGEPDFPTPDHVKAAGIQAIESRSANCKPIVAGTGWFGVGTPVSIAIS